MFKKSRIDLELRLQEYDTQPPAPRVPEPRMPFNEVPMWQSTKRLPAGTASGTGTAKRYRH